MGRWSLPQTEMQTLATCVRKLARLLWTLHLTFQEVHPCPTLASAVTSGPMQLCHDLPGCTPTSCCLHTSLWYICALTACSIQQFLSMCLTLQSFVHVVLSSYALAEEKKHPPFSQSISTAALAAENLHHQTGVVSTECMTVQGFDENMMAMLKQQYPSRLMPQLVQSSQATLQVSLNVQSPLARSFSVQQMETKLQPLVSRLYCYADFSMPTVGLL